MNAVRNTDRMLKIMAYADGELEGAEREEVEAWIAEDAASVRFANELAGLGEILDEGFKKSADATKIASFDITDAIMSKIETSEKIAPLSPAKTEKKLGTGNEKTENQKKEAAAAAVISLDAARAKRNRSIGIAVAVLAVAASVFFIMKNKSGTDEQPMAKAPIVQPSPNNPTPAPNNPNGTVEVNVEQTPGSSVSVFYVPSEAESLSTSVVVWVSDDQQGGK